MSHGHSHAQDPHELDESPYHGTYRGYITGFIISVVLTAIPFWLVMGDVIDNRIWNSVILMGFAAVQMVVHMIFFLHMNGKAEGGWNALAFGFTLILVVIAISGSFWVMYHLNTNMMPSHEMETAF